MARRFTERTATAWASLIASLVVTAGILLTGMGVTLRITPFDLTGMAVITTGLIVMGATLAITGTIGAIANRRWSRDAAAAPADVASGHLTMLVAAATTLPVVLAVLLTPLIAYWRDLIRLADQYDLLATANGPSALVFLPAAGVLLVPGLEAVAAITITMLCAITVLLLLMRSAAVLKLTSVGTMLVGGMCAGCWVGVLATERLAPAVDTLIRTTAETRDQEQARLLELAERHRMVGMRSAQALSAGWVAVVLIALAMRALVHPRATSSDTHVSGVPLVDGLDERDRENALLDAADRLSRDTPPRRF